MSTDFTTTNSWNQLTADREKANSVKYAPLSGKVQSFEDFLRGKGLDPSTLASWQRLELHREYSIAPQIPSGEAGNDGLMVLTLAGGIKVKVDPAKSLEEQKLFIGSQLAPNAITQFEQFQIAESVIPRILQRYDFLK